MTDRATTADLAAPGPETHEADVPTTLAGLATKLQSLWQFSDRYGITCAPADLLREILEDVRRVQAVTAAEWISPRHAAELSGYSTERLRQLAARGQLERAGSRFRRGEIERLKRRVRPRTSVEVLPVSPPVPAPHADDDDGGCAAHGVAARTPPCGHPPTSRSDSRVRNPITGRALDFSSTRMRQ